MRFSRSEVSDEEHMQAMVADDQEREDVSTTASDGDVSMRWSNVCKRQRETEEGDDGDRCTGDAQVERRGHFQRGEKHHHHGRRSRSGDPRTNSIEWYRISEGKRSRFKAKKFRLADVAKVLASVNKLCQRRHRVAFDEEDSYIGTRQGFGIISAHPCGGRSLCD